MNEQCGFFPAGAGFVSAQNDTLANDTQLNLEFDQAGYSVSGNRIALSGATALLRSGPHPEFLNPPFSAAPAAVGRHAHEKVRASGLREPASANPDAPEQKLKAEAWSSAHC